MSVASWTINVNCIFLNCLKPLDNHSHIKILLDLVVLRSQTGPNDEAKALESFNHLVAVSCARVQKLSLRTQNIALASNEGKHNLACKHLLKHRRKKLRIQYKENNFYFINRGKWPQPDPPRLPRGLKHTCTHRNTCTRSCAHRHGGDTCVNHLLGTLSLYTRKKKKGPLT